MFTFPFRPKRQRVDVCTGNQCPWRDVQGVYYMAEKGATVLFNPRSSTFSLNRSMMAASDLFVRDVNSLSKLSSPLRLTPTYGINLTHGRIVVNYL